MNTVADHQELLVQVQDRQLPKDIRIPKDEVTKVIPEKGKNFHTFGLANNEFK